MFFIREARGNNARIRPENLTDKLMTVLKPDGTQSKVFPHSLQSLFGYNGENITYCHRPS